MREPSPDLAYAYGRWARDLAGRRGLVTLDLHVYSARRMWRQVGSWHRRTGLYKIEVAPADLMRGPDRLTELAGRPRPALLYPVPDLSPATAETLQGYLRAQRERRRRAAEMPALATRCGHTPPYIARLLEDYWPDTGQSNRALLLLVSWMVSSGMPEEEAVERATDWLAGAPDALFASPPGDQAREAEKVVHCVYRSGGPSFACPFAWALGLRAGECDV